MYKFFFIALLSLCSSLSFAENKPTYLQNDLEKPSQEISQNTDNLESNLDKQLPSIEYKGAFVKMILALMLVLLLGGVTIWSFKRLTRSRLYSANLNNEIKILEKRILSPKSILYLIEYDGKKMIVSESHLDMKVKPLD